MGAFQCSFVFDVGVLKIKKNIYKSQSFQIDKIYNKLKKYVTKFFYSTTNS